MEQSKLPELLGFLQKVSEMNEDTAYDSSDEYLVNTIITLVEQTGHTSISEDFNTPFIHPMITIQKWNEELKLIVKEKYAQQNQMDQ